MTISTAIKLLNMYLEFNPHRHDLGTAINVVLKELDTLQMNYKLLEEKFDGSAEEKVDKLTEELQTRYNKGYQDGFKQAKFEVEMDKMQEGKQEKVDRLVEKLQEQYKQGYQDGYMAGAMERI